MSDEEQCVLLSAQQGVDVSLLFSELIFPQSELCLSSSLLFHSPLSLSDFGTTCSFGTNLLTSEYQRMEMGLSEMWRITESNSKYK